MELWQRGYRQAGGGQRRCKGLLLGAWLGCVDVLRLAKKTKLRTRRAIAARDPSPAGPDPLLLGPPGSAAVAENRRVRAASEDDRERENSSHGQRQYGPTRGPSGISAKDEDGQNSSSDSGRASRVVVQPSTPQPKAAPSAVQL